MPRSEVVLAVAHRGAPHAHRENTIPAVTSAVHHGADMVEVDLERTSDGVLVLLHDADLNRLWEHDAKVADLTLAELRALTATDGRYRIPTFAEALAISSATGVPLMLDMTEPEFARQCADEVLAEPGAIDRMLFVGGAAAMRAVRESSETARIGLTLGRPWPAYAPDEPMDSIRPQYLNPDCRLLDPLAVATMHEAGYLVSTWTVDSPSHMAYLLDAGVDALITNRVDRLVRLIAARTEVAAA